MLGVVRVCGMRTGVTIYLSSTDRKRLQAMVADRNQQPKPLAWTPIQTKSSPPPIVGIKCWIQSAR